MPEQGTWRISTAYDYVNELDAPDLAWEFLRRNPEYQQDYTRLKQEGLQEDQAEAALCDKWGLSFRGRPRPSCAERQRHVDADRRSLDADPAGAPDLDCTRVGG
ncbi:transcriptional regulator domain-containing protein [Sphingomonas kyeonggiensis]|uniref:transcriptional regulator domain-containing protein n=1 Tax=Sphingomonas kyeonggiensis TaxID=1268553 RepID=UPI003908A450